MPETLTPHLTWNRGLQTEAVKLLRAPGHIVVSPTKVGYIVLATDRAGLERKFEVKNRQRNKPAVVLCGSVDQVVELAELTGEAERFYRTHEEQGVMVSFVDDDGALVPEQHGQRDVTPAPTLIRAGLSLPRILQNLSDQFLSWDYRHGHYY